MLSRRCRPSSDSGIELIESGVSGACSFNEEVGARFDSDMEVDGDFVRCNAGVRKEGGAASLELDCHAGGRATVRHAGEIRAYSAIVFGR